MTACVEIKREAGEHAAEDRPAVSWGDLCQDLFWLFLLGSVAGVIWEGIICIVKKGVWEYHSATIWGPFCVIYGFGAVAVYLLAHAVEKKPLPVQFAVFSIAGTLVEYVGGVFQELSLGTTSWDYSSHFMNLGGKISLKMTLVWGCVSLLAVHSLFPLLNRLFAKMRGNFWRVLCNFAAIFMVIDLTVSCAAIVRWGQRIQQQPAANTFQMMLDERYDDDTMRGLFPNVRFVNDGLW